MKKYGDTSIPIILKAKRIYGKTLELRNVEVSDAEFILALRLDAKKSIHLSVTSNSLDCQRKWIDRYTYSTEQAYFIISHYGEPIGTVRLYDPVEDSFCWGSWILNDNAPMHAGIESALIIYTYAFRILGFNRAHFDVRKKNTKVCKFHERLGASIIREDADNYYFSICKDNAFTKMQRYKKYLDCELNVITMCV